MSERQKAMTILGDIVGLLGGLALSAYFAYQVYLGVAKRDALDGRYFVTDPSFGLLWIGLVLLLVSGGVALARVLFERS